MHVSVNLPLSSISAIYLEPNPIQVYSEVIPTRVSGAYSQESADNISASVSPFPNTSVGPSKALVRNIVSELLGPSQILRAELYFVYLRADLKILKYFKWVVGMAWCRIWAWCHSFEYNRLNTTDFSSGDWKKISSALQVVFPNLFLALGPTV